MEPDEGEAYKAGLADGCAFMKQILRQKLDEAKKIDWSSYVEASSPSGWDNEPTNESISKELERHFGGLCK